LKDEKEEPELKKYLQNQSHQSLEIKTVTPDIEDCFMELMHN
jgi:hypothetical protein